MIDQLSTEDVSDVDMPVEGFTTSLTKKEMQSRSPLISSLRSAVLVRTQST